MRTLIIVQTLASMLVAGYVAASSFRPAAEAHAADPHAVAPHAAVAAGAGAHAAAPHAVPAAGGAHPAGHPAPAPDAVVARLLEGNARFVAGTPQPRALVDARKGLAGGQAPTAIVLSCSDSRVAPELVFDQSLGDLFVVRVAGNVADKHALGSIEYAAEHLHAGVVVVLGHEKCGAVTAAASGGKMPSPNLQALMDEIAPGLPKQEAVPSAALVHDGVEANVAATADELLARSAVLKEHAGHGKLKVVKAVYDLDSGKVRLLP